MQYEQLTAYLRSQSERLLQAWCASVRYPGSPAQRRHLTGPDLLDHLPSLYRMLLVALCDGNSPALEREGQQHGSQRRGFGYSVGEIMEEFRIFRGLVMGAVEEYCEANPASLTGPALAAARLRLGDLIDRSAAASVDRYAREAEAERDAAQAALEKVNRELIEANRHKDRFITVLSHELRNPLAAIVAAADVIGQLGRDDKDIVKSQAIIRRQANHLTRLVDELLDINRVTFGKIELQRRVLPFQEPILLAIESARSGFEADDIRLIIELTSEPLMIHADSQRLTQVVLNLLSNANKFTPHGGRVEVSLRLEATRAVLRVRDSGIGIDPELLPRIFDLYAQAETSPQRQNRGLGIGLALAKSIVEMHNGEIRAHSEGVGQGSEIVVSLPLATS
jgi:signal transduction histidine kinase